MTLATASHSIGRTFASGRDIMCREWVSGEVQLCDLHLKDAEKNYPQGWRAYPGDVCPHGKYTGGSGIDRMCGYCENGE